MNLEEMPPGQRLSIIGLHKLGGAGKRSEIAKAGAVDGLKVAAALTRLDLLGYVESGDDQRWRLTEAGFGLLDGYITVPAAEVRPNPVRAPTKAKAAEPAPDPGPIHPPQPESGSPRPAQIRDAMAAELRAMPGSAPPFSADDAAWLCRALHRQFADMPHIAAMLGSMAAYWTRQGGVDADQAGE